MNIPVYVVNQKMKITMNYKTLVSGTNGFINFVFHVSNDWDGLGLIAQFKQGTSIYKKGLDGSNSAALPKEITSGICNLTLYGTNSGGEIVATTDCVRLVIKQDDVTGDAGDTGSSAPGSGSGGSGSGGSSGGGGTTIVMTDDGEGNVTILTV